MCRTVSETAMPLRQTIIIKPMPTSGTICADAGTSVPLLHNDSPEKLERGPDGMRKPKASGIAGT